MAIELSTTLEKIGSIQNSDNSWTSEPNPILCVSINIDVLIALFTNPSMDKVS